MLKAYALLLLFSFSALAGDSTSKKSSQTVRLVGDSQLRFQDVNANGSAEVALFDHNGAAWTVLNPLPVFTSNTPPGSATYRQKNSTVNVAAGATTDHNYTFTGNTRLSHLFVSSSGLIKATFYSSNCAGALTEIGFVSFNQTGENISVKPESDIDFTSSTCLVVRVLNREADPQDIYSTVEGFGI